MLKSIVICLLLCAGLLSFGQQTRPVVAAKDQQSGGIHTKDMDVFGPWVALIGNELTGGIFYRIKQCHYICGNNFSCPGFPFESFHTSLVEIINRTTVPDARVTLNAKVYSTKKAGDNNYRIESREIYINTTSLAPGKSYIYEYTGFEIGDFRTSKIYPSTLEIHHTNTEQANANALRNQTPKTDNSLNNLWRNWQQLNDSEYNGFVGRKKVEAVPFNKSSHSTSFELKSVYSTPVTIMITFKKDDKQDETFRLDMRPNESHVFQFDADGIVSYDILIDGFTIKGKYYDIMEEIFRKNRAQFLDPELEKKNIKIKARAATLGVRG